MIDETAKLSDLFPQSHMRQLLEVDTDHITTRFTWPNVTVKKPLSP